MNFLEVRNLMVEYTSGDSVVHAVNGVSFSLEKGQTLALVGETGAGKTTIAKSILRILPDPPARVRGGEIYLEGTDLLKISESAMKKVRGGRISMVFQDPMTALNPVKRVGDQIAESIMIHEKVGKDEAFRMAQAMLETVGISGDRAVEYPHQFSGGMKQRVDIAIALACHPNILIADEPTTALDVTIQAQVLKLMKDLKDQFQTSMVMITHDLGIVARTCDEVAVMYAGRIVEEGTLEEIFKKTKHPYTEGLFNSLPNMKDRNSKLKPIKGLISDPTVNYQYCAFADRCPYASEKCWEHIPEKRYFSETHMVMCSAYDDPGFHIARGYENG